MQLLNKCWVLLSTGFPGGSCGKESACKTQIQSLSWEDHLYGKYTHACYTNRNSYRRLL